MTIKTFAVTAGVALATLSAGAVFAADMPKPTMMAMTPMSATVLCRPAVAGDTANATMGTKSLICKSTAPMLVGGKMPTPTTLIGTSTAHSDAAWRTWLLHVIEVNNNAQQGG